MSIVLKALANIFILVTNTLFALCGILIARGVVAVDPVPSSFGVIGVATLSWLIYSLGKKLAPGIKEILAHMMLASVLTGAISYIISALF